MAKVNLTLGESKSKVDLSLEQKDSGITWDTAIWSWDDADSTWDAAKVSLAREAKTKVDLSLEAK